MEFWGDIIHQLKHHNSSEKYIFALIASLLCFAYLHFFAWKMFFFWYFLVVVFSSKQNNKWLSFYWEGGTRKKYIALLLTFLAGKYKRTIKRLGVGWNIINVPTFSLFFLHLDFLQYGTLLYGCVVGWVIYFDILTGTIKQIYFVFRLGCIAKWIFSCSEV